MGFLGLDARGDGVGNVAQFDQAVDGQEGFALVQGAHDAVVQGVGGEGFEDVVVGGQFGGAHHPLVLALAGDHDEQGCQRNDAVVTQVFEEVLAVLSVADMVFAEDQVKAVVAQLADRDPGGHRELDLADPARVEHVAKLRPHGRIGFDDEG
jgi:hypothetical protein